MLFNTHIPASDNAPCSVPASACAPTPVTYLPCFLAPVPDLACAPVPGPASACLYDIFPGSAIFPVPGRLTVLAYVPALLPVLACNSAPASTCLFTRLAESSLVPAGFLTAQFLQKT